MRKKKTVAVLGLGIFGGTVSKYLAEKGHEVIAADNHQENVDRIAPFGVHAYVTDFTNIDNLKAIGIQDVDIAVVATGSHLENSVIAVMNLKELGVKRVIAKAMNKKYMEVLLKVGADRVIRPEKEMGERLAKQIASNDIVDLIEIDKDYNIVEMKVPRSFNGKTLAELDLRKKYGINILGIRDRSGNLDVMLTADKQICEEDNLLFILNNKKVESFSLD